MTPVRSSPSMRNPTLGPVTFHFAFRATARKAAGSSGTKSSCARLPAGNPEKARRLTPASRSVWRARAPLPGLSGAIT